MAGTCFVAAALSGGDPFRIGFMSMQLSSVGYILPFLFLFDPAIVMQGTGPEILASVVRVTVGVLALAVGFAGWFRSGISWPERIVWMVAAALLIEPSIIGSSVAAGLLVLLLVWEFALRRRFQPGAARNLAS